jgi:tetratricopeptide (TPR) repeat protein
MASFERAGRIARVLGIATVGWLGILMLRPLAAQAQIPDKFTNLQVLPKDIPKAELVSTMRGYSMALGVRCEYCHVEDETKTPHFHDFASDEKGPKKTARLMMQMTGELNHKWIEQVKSDRKEHAVVQCATCHHGQTVPRSLQSILDVELTSGGMPALDTKYRELRGKYYGRDSYDFGEQSLNEMARRLTDADRPSDAVAILQLNAEFNPQSSPVQMFMGDAFAKSGDKEKAAACYRKALELNPQNEAAKRRLAELETK